MSTNRRPGAFDVDSPAPVVSARIRRPTALSGEDLARVQEAEIDVFDTLDATDPPPPPLPRRRGPGLAGMFATALGVLVSLALGIWADGLIRELFSRADWLGWIGVAAAVVAVVALLAILAREAAALSRLASVEALRRSAAEVVESNDARAARRVVDRIVALAESRPSTAAGRRLVAEQRGEVVDGTDLLALAETGILAPLDAQAQQLILDSGKRVSLVTAVSPRAAVDLIYVGFEATRLIRRIAELYGGRPGTLGFFRLFRSVLSHLAVTGTVAAGDSLVQQIVGQGLAARLSAKLGEGVVNGMMTVRIGIAAMEAARPLPFRAVKRPGASEFLAALASFARDRSARTEG